MSNINAGSTNNQNTDQATNQTPPPVVTQNQTPPQVVGQNQAPPPLVPVVQTVVPQTNNITGLTKEIEEMRVAVQTNQLQLQRTLDLLSKGISSKKKESEFSLSKIEEVPIEDQGLKSVFRKVGSLARGLEEIAQHMDVKNSDEVSHNITERIAECSSMLKTIVDIDLFKENFPEVATPSGELGKHFRVRRNHPLLKDRLKTESFYEK